MSKKIYLTESQFKSYIKEMTNKEINNRCKNINHNPTEAQKKASNYKMAHVIFSGFKITIENAKGSKRYWKDNEGNTGYNEMKNHYGYFSNSIGYDGDHIDVFLGKNQDSDKIYVVDQNKSDGSFDESKIMLGFNSKKEAKEAYLSNFSSQWKGFRNITGVTKEFFKKWLYDGKKQRKPFSDYVEVAKQKINESLHVEFDDDFALIPTPSAEDIKKFKEKERRANAAKKAAETRKRKKEEKIKQAVDALYAKQREMGWKDLFGE